MSMTAPPSSGGNDFEKHPPGQVNLICTRIIDKGTVFNAIKQESKRKISFVFESSTVMGSGDFAGKPFLLFGNFNYSMYQNALMCKFIEGWRGARFVDQAEADHFDIASMLGQPLFANIVHNGDFVNIDSPMPALDALPIPKIQGDSYLFSFQAPDVKSWMMISEKMREKMKTVPEYKEWEDSPIPGPEESFETMPEMEDQPTQSKKTSPVDPEFDDDIPF